jgi:hypothetical protein
MKFARGDGRWVRFEIYAVEGHVEEQKWCVEEREALLVLRT